jgi:nicotinamide-nucleotide amidase
MFPEPLKQRAQKLLDVLRAQNLRIATAESCTGGLIVALLTDFPGSSSVVECGFVTYSNEAKAAMIGVRPELIAEHGVVSREVALAMARGALGQSKADVSVSVTGIAGPGGGTVEKPVGLVHIAAARRGCEPVHRECRFGALDRTGIRICATDVALTLAGEAALLEPPA